MSLLAFKLLVNSGSVFRQVTATHRFVEICFRISPLKSMPVGRTNEELITTLFQ